MTRSTAIGVKPRVTEIIRRVGLAKDYSAVPNMEYYQERGTACHMAIQLYLKGTLNPDSIDESYFQHFAGFTAFWRDFGQKEFQSELHLENDDYQGTLDLVMEGMVWDFKTSKDHDKVAEIQLAGYKKLLGNDAPAKVVQLPGDGTYRIFDYAAPVNLWECCWTLYSWKVKRRS